MSKSFSDINIQNYSDKAIVVRGNTRKYKEDLKKLGGKYNGRLSAGPGWIFSKKSELEVKSFISDGVRLVSKTEELAGEELSKEWEIKRSEKNSHDETHAKKFQKLNSKIDALSKKIDKMMVLLNTVKGNDNDNDSDSESELIPTKRLLR